MSKRLRVALAMIGFLVASAGLLWWRLTPTADDAEPCVYRYVYANDAELARRLMARARLLLNRQNATLLFDHDEWWRAARLLPKSGIVKCPTFRATITYAVDETDQEHVTVEGDREAFGQWRGKTKADRSSPFWVDLRKWERR